MPRNKRLELIKRIESARDSRVLCYLTGDRRGFETKIASDVFSLIFDHLKNIGATRQIDLFMYSTGGVSIAGWGLVNLIREFCARFCVLVPFKVHSCATLIALGADEIVMGRLGQLSPIDPSITSPYNPAAPGLQQAGPTNLLPVNVEDVVGYIKLARDEAGLKEDSSMAQVFENLSNKVHPLALGAVHRSREQITMLAEKLLGFHMKQEEKERAQRIVTTLTKELFSHDYIIGRKEAKHVIGLKVVDVPQDQEEAIWLLYKEYENMLELVAPFTADAFLEQQNLRVGVFRRAVIESAARTDIFTTQKEIRRVEVQQPGIPLPIQGFQERIISEGWQKDVTD